MKKLFFPLLILLIIGYSCSDPLKPKSNEFVVKGKLKNTKGESIYLEELLIDKTQVVDSTKFNEEGEFFFKHQIKEPGFYLLRVKSKKFITLLINPVESLNITGDAQQLEKTYSVSGSEESEKINKMYLHYYKNLARVDSLREIYVKNQDNPDLPEIQHKLDSSFLLIYKDQQKYIKQFINDNSGSLVSVLALFQSFAQKRVIPQEEEIPFAEKIDKNLFEKYPKNTHVINLHERVAKLKREEAEKKLIEQRLAIGAVAPDFALTGVNGDTIRLSSLRGKIVLLDFWSSLCEECVKETFNLHKLYKKYHEKGFEIYGIGVERDEKMWKKALKDLQIYWIQASDYNDMASPIITLYNVSKIPYTYLIDREGKIIAKGLSDDELAKKLQELLGGNDNQSEVKKSKDTTQKTNSTQ